MRFGLLACLLLIGAAPPPSPAGPIDPLTIDSADFLRHRDSAEWTGLTVTASDFTEERETWRLWRIEDRARPQGPLWFVPHDNESAGFEAALVAIRRYGGTIVAVDSGGGRMNRDVAFGAPVDPNRNFHDGLPAYPRAVLSAVNRGAWPIIALHTNAQGYDQTRSTCPHPEDPPGRGDVSIRFCSRTLQPSPSRGRAYPFDDDDTVAYATYNARGTPDDAYCATRMAAADFNVIHERVVDSDGSLSNYAVLHRLAYLNFETQDRGLAPDGLVAARDRLVWMIDHALALCARPEDQPRTVVRLTFR